MFAAGEARLVIAAVILAIALIIFGIRMFCRFVAWLTPDGNPLRRLVVAGLFLLAALSALFPIFPPAASMTARLMPAPENEEPPPVRPTMPTSPTKRADAYAPGE